MAYVATYRPSGTISPARPIFSRPMCITTYRISPVRKPSPAVARRVLVALQGGPSHRHVKKASIFQVRPGVLVAGEGQRPPRLYGGHCGGDTRRRWRHMLRRGKARRGGRGGEEERLIRGRVPTIEHRPNQENERTKQNQTK